MNYNRYFTELKYRLASVTFFWFFTLLVCYVNRDPLVFLLVNSTESHHHLNLNKHFVVMGVLEILSLYFDLILYISGIATLFYLFYHGVSFYAPSLRGLEYTYFVLLNRMLLVGWFASALITSKVLLPVSWQFFMATHDSLRNFEIPVYFEANLTSYLRYCKNVFNMCVCVSYFALISITNMQFIMNNLAYVKTIRKLFYSGVLLLATLLTPPDVFSQLTVATLFILIYEILLILGILNLEAN